MIVGLVTDEYPPARVAGGIGSYTRNLARLLAGHNHEVHVFCQHDGITKTTSGEIIHSVKACDLPTRLLRYVYYRSLGRLASSLQFRIRWGVSVGRAIRGIEQHLGRPFDVVEIPDAGGYAGLIRLGGLRSPILIRMHCAAGVFRRHAGVPVSFSGRLIECLERWSIRYAGLVTAPSDAIVRETRADLGIGPESRVLTYPNPLPAGDDKPNGNASSRDPYLLLAVGWLSLLKGTDLALDAFQDLHDEIPALRLVLIGRNLGMPAIEAKLHSMRLRTSRLTCAGEVASEEVGSWMARAGILIVPSRFESYSLVTVEALRSGCLVIAARSGALPEIITHGVNGLLFEPGSRRDLVRMVKWALEHPDRCEEIRRMGLHWVAEHLAPTRLLHSITSAYALAKQSRGNRPFPC
jgi:glycogen synthase